MHSQNGSTVRRLSADLDPFSKAEIYYGDPSAGMSSKNRSFSQKITSDPPAVVQDIRAQRRRGSEVAATEQSRKFLIPVESTMKELLLQEDSDKNCQITIDDEGPKVRGRCCLRRR